VSCLVESVLHFEINIVHVVLSLLHLAINLIEHGILFVQLLRMFLVSAQHGKADALHVEGNFLQLANVGLDLVQVQILRHQSIPTSVRRYQIPIILL
jgi:hypothetical protein